MEYSRSIQSTIKQRFSCRSFATQPIDKETINILLSSMKQPINSPFNSNIRFDLITASTSDRASLRGLVTYGFIKNPTGFLIGSVHPSKKNLEDFGYAMEILVLKSTELGLGTCWLGGSFNKSGFASKILKSEEELIPCIIAMGIFEDENKARASTTRRTIGADKRLPWESLFFDNQFSVSLTKEKAGKYIQPLEMVRVGPSASKKQPWRVVRCGSVFHFYLERTPGYPGGLAKRLLQIDDLQRVDMGIAMSHFELVARELGLNGRWEDNDPKMELPSPKVEYTASWIAAE